jgi:hypothetical protein
MGEKAYLCLVVLDPCGKDHWLCWASGLKSKVHPLAMSAKWEWLCKKIH